MISNPSNPPKITKEKLEEVRNLARTSLKFLCKEILWMNAAEKESMWGEVHSDLARFLHTSGRRKHIELARGHLKSSIVTKAWTIQQILKNPNLRVLIANSVWDNSRKFLGTIQKYLGAGSALEAIFGPMMGVPWTQDAMTIRPRTSILDAATWTSTGIEKEQTSQHYDLIIADDLVARENVMTPEQREKVYLYYKDLFDLLEPDGTIVVIGTRWHEDDLYAKIFEENDEAEKCGLAKPWDCFIRTVYNPDGSPTFPDKFTPEHIAQLRATKGPYEFSAQYLNNPLDESAADFKRAWIKYYDPTTSHPASLYLTVDPAISLSRDADQSALVVAGQFQSRIIRVVDRVAGRWVPHELVDRIFELVAKWKLHRIGIESFTFQKTLKYAVQAEQRKRNIFFSIDELGARRGGKDPLLTKEARIRRLQPYFEQGLIEIRHDMKDLEMELLAFPRGRHDDLLDALAYQLDYLIPSINRVPVQGIIPGSFRDILQKSWEHQGTSLYQKFMSDLKERPETPYVP